MAKRLSLEIRNSEFRNSVFLYTDEGRALANYHSRKQQNVTHFDNSNDAFVFLFLGGHFGAYSLWHLLSGSE